MNIRVIFSVALLNLQIHVHFLQNWACNVPYQLALLLYFISWRYHPVACFINMVVILDYCMLCIQHILATKCVTILFSNISRLHSVHEVPVTHWVYSGLQFIRSLNNKFRLKITLFRLYFIDVLFSHSVWFH